MVEEFIKNLRKKAEEEFIPVMRERTTEILKITVAENRPKEVLEIGTSLGVSGITVLTSGGERLTTIDRDGDILEEAKRNFAECGVKDRTTFIEGDCFDTLRYLEGNTYDMVILDGPKSKYSELYDLTFDMVSSGGIIFCDDVDFHGYVREDYVEHKHRTIVRGMMNFYEKIKSDVRVEGEFLSVEDGIAIIRKK